MFIYFVLSILIGIFMYYLVNQIEPFSMQYVPLDKRNLTETPPINYDTLITNPKKEYNTALTDWKQYLKIQTEIRNAFEEKGSDSNIHPYVASDLRWRIHRWSMWDYLPNLDYPYYCRVQQFNGKETCQPLSNKLYCSVDKLYKSPVECLKNLDNNKNNTDK